jgi:hypothetical protein
MIYSKFGTILALVSKTRDADGRVRVQATVDGTPEVHDYALTELKADEGMTEINAAVEALPMRVFDTRGKRRRPL